MGGRSHGGETDRLRLGELPPDKPVVFLTLIASCHGDSTPTRIQRRKRGSWATQVQIPLYLGRGQMHAGKEVQLGNQPLRPNLKPSRILWC